MKFLKNRTRLIAGIFLATGFLTGCSGGAVHSDRVVYLNHDGSDLVGGTLMRDAILKTANSKGIDIEVLDAKGDSNTQFDQMKSTLDKGAQSLILVAIDNDSIMPLVKQANQRGVQIITINRDINDGERVNVGCNEYEAGKLQAEYLLKTLPQGANVVYLEGIASLKIAQMRWEGFKKECLDKRPDITLLDIQDGKWSKAEAMKIVSLWLSIFPKVDAVVCANDQMALGAIEALKASGRLQGCQVVGVDAIDEALNAIERGEMVLSIKMDLEQQGKGVTQILETVRSGGTPSNVVVPYVSITKENLAQFKK